MTPAHLTKREWRVRFARIDISKINVEASEIGKCVREQTDDHEDDDEIYVLGQRTGFGSLLDASTDKGSPSYEKLREQMEMIDLAHWAAEDMEPKTEDNSTEIE